jgi:hypothetical protein
MRLASEAAGLAPPSSARLRARKVTGAQGNYADEVLFRSRRAARVATRRVLFETEGRDELAGLDAWGRRRRMAARSAMRPQE